MTKVVGIHQPNFFPWIGYFMKMKQCHAFIFLDDVQLNKESYTRRVKIRHPNKEKSTLWLTVPLIRHKHDTMIHQLMIDHSQDWIGKHLQTIKQAYRKTSNWAEKENWLVQLFQSFKEMDYLVEVNKSTIHTISKLLHIEVDFVDANTLGQSGKKDEYTLILAEHLGATHYVRGKGERKYSSSFEWKKDEAPKIIDTSIETWRADIEGQYPQHQIGLSTLDLILVSDGIDFTRL